MKGINQEANIDAKKKRPYNCIHSFNDVIVKRKPRYLMGELGHRLRTFRCFAGATTWEKGNLKPWSTWTPWPSEKSIDDI